jgi:hypothetical protein
MRTTRHLTALVLGAGLTAVACDQPPADTASQPNPDPLASLGLDEGDQVPNLVATVKTGTSIVMFSEPMPGTVMVLEKGRGKTTLRSNTRDFRQLWNKLAPGQEMPLALRESMDRLDRGTTSLAGARRGEGDSPAAPARPTGAAREQQTRDLARDLQRNNEQLGMYEQQLTRSTDQSVNADTGCGDDQHFINNYCSNWMYAANVSEECKLRKQWNGTGDAVFGPWNDVEYSFAAVCGRRGEFDFVVQHMTWWSWSTACDLNTTEGIHWNMALRSAGLDWDFRYIFQRAGGDAYHRAHYVDSESFDPSGLGSHQIPPT